MHGRQAFSKNKEDGKCMEDSKSEKGPQMILYPYIEVSGVFFET